MTAKAKAPAAPQEPQIDAPEASPPGPPEIAIEAAEAAIRDAERAVLDPILTLEQRDATGDVPEAFIVSNKRIVETYKEPSEVIESVTSLGFAMRSYE